MIDLRQDLIEEELNKFNVKMTFKKLKPSKRFIDWLFRHYYTDEFAIHWYDSDITFNNWIDPFGEGIWEMSQYQTDRCSRNALCKIRSAPVKKKGRLYISYFDDGDIYIYWYGRDYMYCDYWWYMKRK